MKHAREDYNRIQDPAGLIPEDEPVFLLRGQDACSTYAIREWIRRAEQFGASPAIIKAAKNQIDRMHEWQSHDIKVPDLMAERNKDNSDAS